MKRRSGFMRRPSRDSSVVFPRRVFSLNLSSCSICLVFSYFSVFVRGSSLSVLLNSSWCGEQAMGYKKSSNIDYWYLSPFPKYLDNHFLKHMFSLIVTRTFLFFLPCLFLFPRILSVSCFFVFCFLFSVRDGKMVLVHVDKNNCICGVAFNFLNDLICRFICLGLVIWVELTIYLFKKA